MTIEPEWLLELFEGRIDEETKVHFNEARQRVEVASRMLYDGLVLDEAQGAGSEDEVEPTAVLRRVRGIGIKRHPHRGKLA